MANKMLVEQVNFEKFSTEISVSKISKVLLLGNKKFLNQVLQKVYHSVQIVTCLSRSNLSFRSSCYLFTMLFKCLWLLICYIYWSIIQWWYSGFVLIIHLTHWGRYFLYNIFKCIFLNENVWFFIKISLKFVPKGPVNNIPALVQMAPIRRQAIIWANDGLAYWCIYVSLSLNE